MKLNCRIQPTLLRPFGDISGKIGFDTSGGV